ncbi:hypothetical protein RI367_003670 [Sorochytrium milnesiophthora]
MGNPVYVEKPVSPHSTATAGSTTARGGARGAGRDGEGGDVRPLISALDSLYQPLVVFEERIRRMLDLSAQLESVEQASARASAALLAASSADDAFLTRRRATIASSSPTLTSSTTATTTTTAAAAGVGGGAADAAAPGTSSAMTNPGSRSTITDILAELAQIWSQTRTERIGDGDSSGGSSRSSLDLPEYVLGRHTADILPSVGGGMRSGAGHRRDSSDDAIMVFRDVRPRLDATNHAADTTRSFAIASRRPPPPLFRRQSSSRSSAASTNAGTSTNNIGSQWYDFDTIMNRMGDTSASSSSNSSLRDEERDSTGIRARQSAAAGPLPVRTMGFQVLASQTSPTTPTSLPSPPAATHSPASVEIVPVSDRDRRLDRALSGASPTHRTTTANIQLSSVFSPFTNASSLSHTFSLPGQTESHSSDDSGAHRTAAWSGLPATTTTTTTTALRRAVDSAWAASHATSSDDRDSSTDSLDAYLRARRAGPVNLETTGPHLTMTIALPRTAFTSPPMAAIAPVTASTATISADTAHALGVDELD